MGITLTNITLPRYPEDCNKILRTLKRYFDKYSSQIKSMLKTYRCTAHYISLSGFGVGVKVNA